MITIEEYKQYLTNTYKHEIDNTEERRENRKVYLTNHYKDEYLNKIIKDTSNLINIILNISNINYYFIKMSDYNVQYISLNLTGGWNSDTIYEDIDGNLISEHILKKTLGNQLSIDIKEIAHEFDTEDPDILSYDYEYYLYLQGFEKPKSKKLTKTNIN